MAAERVQPDLENGAAAFLQSAERAATQDDGSEGELEVLEENWDATDAFQRCKQHYAIGFSRVIALGFTAQEIQAACQLCGIPRKRWPEASRLTHEMGHIAAELLNAKHS